MNLLFISDQTQSICQDEFYLAFADQDDNLKQIIEAATWEDYRDIFNAYCSK